MDKRQEALAEYREKLASGEIEKQRQKTPREKLDSNPSSLRAAINCFCFECLGESRADVKACTVKKCPLWNVRPWQKNNESDDGQDD